MNRKKRPVIAIIDDEPHIRNSLAQYLSEIGGYETIAFESGTEAIQWFEKNTTDLCIVDIKMPGIDGMETITHLKKLRPELKYIIFTGSRFQNLTEIAVKFQIPEEFIIVKPLSAMEIFLDKINKILQNKQ